MYGAQPGAASFANNCLLARRLVERGVRYVQLFDWGWDCHGTGKGDDIVYHLPEKCKEIDRPVAALLKDLKRRGLLDETIVVWGGEFGRTSMNEARGGSTFLGRDHHPHCFTLWVAGGGFKGGISLGATDDLGYQITENPVTVHDLQATILHLLGLDPRSSASPTRACQQRLIGVEGDGQSAEGIAGVGGAESRTWSGRLARATTCLQRRFWFGEKSEMSPSTKSRVHIAVSEGKDRDDVMQPNR